MKRRNIYEYIKKNIEDQYILDVMYYCLRNLIQMTIFNGVNIKYFKISKKFVPDEVQLPFHQNESTPSDVLGILLSIRAIMLDTKNIEYCYDDRLIFCRFGKKEFGWLDYANLINMYNKDEEFHLILRILADFVEGRKILLEDKDKFIAQTKSPECRNILNYYKDKLLDPDSDKSDMILNCAHVCDDAIESFVVNREIEYVGDTAFAYCNRLKSIEFKSPWVVFGKFPILECKSLEHIIVPVGSGDYYRSQLPYYKDIIVELADSKAIEITEPITDETSLINNSDVTDDVKDFINNEPESADANSVSEIAPEFPTMKSMRTRERIKVQSSNPLNWAKEKIKDSLSLLKKKEIVNDDDVENRNNKIKESFSKKVTTYKYFWFLSILKQIERKGVDAHLSIKELTEEMIVQSWGYVGEETSFPSADQIPGIVIELWENRTIEDDTEVNVRKIVRSALLQDTTIQKKVNGLGKNAPYRFLSPWIPFVSTKEVEKDSCAFKNDCPYSIYGDEVNINPDWMNFFKKHNTSISDYIIDEINKVVRQ